MPIVEVADLSSQPIQHAVGFSNHQVGRTAARYLVAKGFRKIGAVASQSGDETGDYRGEERIRGFEEELRLSGLSTDLVLRHGAPPVSYEHGAAAIGILLDRDPGIEAVFAVSDLSALGVAMECQRRNVDVPGRLSVMGFGDFEIGREINPPLTTVHVDFRAIALDDEDREPFLENVATALAGEPGAVASCSALTRAYRDLLRARRPGLGGVTMLNETRDTAVGIPDTFAPGPLVSKRSIPAAVFQSS